jgi:hypothetical protein
MEPTPHDDPYDDLLDPEWEQPKRTSRLTVALVAALLVVLGFAGGALTQRAITPDAPTTVTGGPGAGQQGASPAGGGGVRRAGPQGGGSQGGGQQRGGQQGGGS